MQSIQFMNKTSNTFIFRKNFPPSQSKWSKLWLNKKWTWNLSYFLKESSFFFLCTSAFSRSKFFCLGCFLFAQKLKTKINKVVWKSNFLSFSTQKSKDSSSPSLSWRRKPDHQSFMKFLASSLIHLMPALFIHFLSRLSIISKSSSRKKKKKLLKLY